MVFYIHKRRPTLWRRKVTQVKWTKDAVMVEAAKYDNKAAFQQYCRTGYMAARRLNIMAEACAHMPMRKKRASKWDDISALRAEASKYDCRGHFSQRSPGAYIKAVRLGIVGELFADKPLRSVRHSDAELKAEAAKYQHRREFQTANKNMYSAALYRGILDDICAHMGAPVSGFDNSDAAIVYYLKIEHPVHGVLYKIGITNHSVAYRYAAESIHITELAVWTYDHGADARNHERKVIVDNAAYRYRGSDRVFKRGGNTELFTCDILGLDREAA